METRTVFVAGLVLLACALGPLGVSSNGQNPVAPAQEPRPGQEPPSEGPRPNTDKKILEENDKDIKKKVERLYELASELKEQVDKTDSSKVLSLNLMKKAEEIEKLARDIKNRSKG
jgi:peptidoglycan hydrolase CwlO-like protein